MTFSFSQLVSHIDRLLSHMKQSAVSTHDEHSEFLGVPVFWFKPTPDPPFAWEIWIGHFFLAINYRGHYDHKNF